ncbi:methylase involved in ubiquinone/menaquinone biosynthesis [Synechococcus sp. PCC 7502]|uniref:class I SAM-dependent methyltransferase n=1 Tax=Synechococcus sp. PCC 7502 TaxID=1173263 RepID=UPI00029F9A3D|nr:class I SAM-dependent methyltransferase [Synechococcus sp. PCC 7502]AFY73049.1 methylase involved in ubiquinone/menaquinone biosynthesis [Synechococcus sp. PCC 7502]
MSSSQSDLLEKIRQQFDSSPYPRIPLDKSPKDNPIALYIHNLVTSFYLRDQRVIDTKGKVILDAGCGSGYRSLILAEANPGAKIVGVDISSESVKLAEQRLKHHGFDNTEFYVLSLEDISSLGYQFDYINCDELLYLFPNPVEALKAMRSVLKLDGILRTNLHSSYQRSNFFRAQSLFSMMGLLDSNPEEMEIEIVVDTMEALKDDVLLKIQTWKNLNYSLENKEGILMNHLFQGDKGYTIADMFSFLRASNLEFISMVNWREWDFRDLFKDANNLPVVLAMGLEDMSIEARLQLYEILNPIHRLLDFWCGHPQPSSSFIPFTNWTDNDWHCVKVYLHPQLLTENFKQILGTCIRECKPLYLNQLFSTHKQVVTLDSSIVSSLLPLLEAPQTIDYLVVRWMQIRPIDPLTLEATEPETAFNLIRDIIKLIENLDYLILEPQERI